MTGKKSKDQLQLDLAKPSASANSEARSNVVSVDQFRIRTHTERVLMSLREQGLLRSKDKN